MGKQFDEFFDRCLKDTEEEGVSETETTLGDECDPEYWDVDYDDDDE